MVITMMKDPFFSEEEVENFIDKLDPLASDPDIQSETAVPSVEDD